ncbi:MAG TPA: RNA polymerase sigma factor [Verrucomicrobiae bacterium]
MNSEAQAAEDRFLAVVAENRLRILKVCHVYAWQPEELPDLYQEILIQVWRSLPKLKNQAYTNTWLYRVALNTAISFGRKHKARREKTISHDHAMIQQLLDAKTSGEPAADPRVAVLYQAIAKLDDMEKAVVTLFLEDLSYEQIAEVTGMTVSHAGVTLHRAKKKLSALMEGGGHE